MVNVPPSMAIILNLTSPTVKILTCEEGEDASSCFTFNVMVPLDVSTVIVAIREVEEVFSSTFTVTLPSLFPNTGFTLHQSASLETIQEIFE
jgi:hypothetical protein